MPPHMPHTHTYKLARSHESQAEKCKQLLQISRAFLLLVCSRGIVVKGESNLKLCGELGEVGGGEEECSGQ